MNYLLSIIFLVFCLYSQGQTQQLEDKLELIQEDLTSNELDFTILQDQLDRFKQRPIYLNHTQFSELEQLPFLNSSQIINLLNYVNEFGPFLAWEELMRVELMNIEIIKNLKTYCTLSEKLRIKRTLKTILENEAKLEFTTRFKLQTNKTYLRDFNEQGFEGSPLKSYQRIRYSAPNAFSLGIILEKDPGEAFLNKSHPTNPDFVSAHAFYQNEKTLLKNLVLGDFQYQSGQGLLVNTSFGFNKSAQSLNILKTSNGFRPYTSVNENEFLRGIATQIGGKQIFFDSFISYKKIDGRSRDSLQQSLYTSGLHRNDAELNTRKTINELVLGEFANYKTNKTLLSAGILHYRLNDTTTAVTSTLYGANFRHQLNSGLLFGELAQQNATSAYLIGSIFTLTPSFSTSVLYRNYPSTFKNRFANGFSSNSTNTNETGFYFGAEYLCSRNWKINFYLDQYQLNAPSFYTNSPASLRDILVQVNLSVRHQYAIYFRARIRTRQKDEGTATPFKTSYLEEKQNYRLQSEFTISKQLKMRNRFEFSFRNWQDQKSNAYLIYQDLFYKMEKVNCDLTFRYAIFNAASFDDRIYAYEQDVPYSYSIPAYYSAGQRYYIILNKRINSKLSVWVKAGNWIYLSNTLNSKTEFTLQIRYLP